MKKYVNRWMFNKNAGMAPFCSLEGLLCNIVMVIYSVVMSNSLHIHHQGSNIIIFMFILFYSNQCVFCNNNEDSDKGISVFNYSVRIKTYDTISLFRLLTFYQY